MWMLFVIGASLLAAVIMAVIGIISWYRWLEARRIARQSADDIFPTAEDVDDQENELPELRRRYTPREDQPCSNG